MVDADRTTTIAINRVLSEPCPGACRGSTREPEPVVPVQAPARPRHRRAAPTMPRAIGRARGRASRTVQGRDGRELDPDQRRSGIRRTAADCPAIVPPPAPTAPADFADEAAAHWACELRHTGEVAALHRGRTADPAGPDRHRAPARGRARDLRHQDDPQGRRPAVQGHALHREAARRPSTTWSTTCARATSSSSFYEHFKAGHAGVRRDAGGRTSRGSGGARGGRPRTGGLARAGAAEASTSCARCSRRRRSPLSDPTEPRRRRRRCGAAAEATSASCPTTCSTRSCSSATSSLVTLLSARHRRRARLPDLPPGGRRPRPT